MTHNIVKPDGATSNLHSHFGQRPTMTSSLRPHKTRSGRTKYHIHLPAYPSSLLSTSVLIPCNRTHAHFNDKQIRTHMICPQRFVICSRYNDNNK